MNRQRHTSKEFPFILFENNLKAVCGAAMLFQTFERRGQPTKGICLEYPLGTILSHQLSEENLSSDLFIVGSKRYIEAVEKLLFAERKEGITPHTLNPSSLDDCLALLAELSPDDPSRLFDEQLLGQVLGIMVVPRQIQRKEVHRTLVRLDDARAPSRWRHALHIHQAGAFLRSLEKHPASARALQALARLEPAAGFSLRAS